MMTSAQGKLADACQALVDARLDTIDRMLLGRVSRADRLAIVREVEGQIYELMGEHDLANLSRDEVLGVLARLDPPEAYLPEEEEAPKGGIPSQPRPLRLQTTQRATTTPEMKRGEISGILGIIALAMSVLSPLVFFAAVATDMLAIAVVVVGLWFLTIVSLNVISFIYVYRSRLTTGWAVAGLVTSILSMLWSFFVAILLLLDAG